MARLDIRLEGDPILRQRASRIRHVDDGLRRLAADMFETMIEEHGVGLAAPQIGISRRLIVVHVPAGYDHDDDPEISLMLVNPEIVRSRGRYTDVEGCLSIPGWLGDVDRAEHVTVKAMDLENREIRIKLDGHAARVMQHEIDHLDGVLYVDHIADKSTMRRLEDEDETVEVSGDQVGSPSDSAA